MDPTRNENLESYQRITSTHIHEINFLPFLRKSKKLITTENHTISQENTETTITKLT